MNYLKEQILSEEDGEILQMGRVYTDFKFWIQSPGRYMNPTVALTEIQRQTGQKIYGGNFLCLEDNALSIQPGIMQLSYSKKETSFKFFIPKVFSPPQFEFLLDAPEAFIGMVENSLNLYLNYNLFLSSKEIYLPFFITHDMKQAFVRKESKLQESLEERVITSEVQVDLEDKRITSDLSTIEIKEILQERLLRRINESKESYTPLDRSKVCSIAGITISYLEKLKQEGRITAFGTRGRKSHLNPRDAYYLINLPKEKSKPYTPENAMSLLDITQEEYFVLENKGIIKRERRNKKVIERPRLRSLYNEIFPALETDGRYNPPIPLPRLDKRDMVHRPKKISQDRKIIPLSTLAGELGKDPSEIYSSMQKLNIEFSYDHSSEIPLPSITREQAEQIKQYLHNVK